MRDCSTKSCLASLTGALLLSACASSVPVNIREAPPGNPTLAEVRTDPPAHRAEQVRWGGVILETENRENATWLTLLARPLTGKGEPERTDRSEGRFLARVPAFLDPRVYQEERRVTVRGTLQEPETRQVGDFAYTYPVIDASDWYLWPKEVDYPPGYYYPWWYDPFYYDPWFYDPWYRYPYYPIRHHHKDKSK